jgi:hypothetical protein
VLIALVCGTLGVVAFFILRDQLIPEREARLLRGERARVRRDDIVGALTFAAAGAIIGLVGSVA